jgi:HEAT repeat protein
LGPLGDSRAVEPLIALLRVGLPTIPEKIAPSFAARDAAIKALWRQVSGLPNEARLDALRAAARTLSPEEARLVSSSPEEARLGALEAAATALGSLRDQRAIEILIVALTTVCVQDPDPDPASEAGLFPHAIHPKFLAQSLNSAAEAALKKIDPEWRRTAEARRSVPFLLSVLVDPRKGINSGVAQILDTIDPDWPLLDAARSCVPQAIMALRDWRNRRDWVVGVLARIGDPRSAEALLGMLRLRHADLNGETARGLVALGAPAAAALVGAAKQITDVSELKGIVGVRRAIRLRNQGLVRQMGRLVCARCYLRASTVKGSLGRPWCEKFVVCRGCGSATHLRGGVRTLVGVIGGDRWRPWQEGDGLFVPLWREHNGTARYGEIDRLVVAEGGAADHDRAVAAVVKELADGACGSRKRLRKVTVLILDPPALSDDSRLLLRETFQSVSEQG